ncbi:hypothetical protein MUP01_12755 [Candidatus Bathyarchaeota archaeon]|nr:hypothetical protein [Candidatus Bathyarchaeota archaeon]
MEVKTLDQFSIPVTKKGYSRAYYLKHKQKLSEYHKEWRQKHPEYRLRQKKYRQQMWKNEPEKYEEMKKKARERQRKRRQNEQLREKEILQHKIYRRTDKAKAAARRRYKRLMEKAALLIGDQCFICDGKQKIVFHERNGVSHYRGFRYDKHVERFIPLCQRHHRMLHSLIAFTKLTLTEQTKIYELLPHSIEMPIKNVVQPTSPSLART